MALESLEARIEQREIRDLDNTHGDASTKTPYGERLLRADEIRLLVIERSAGTLRRRRETGRRGRCHGVVEIAVRE